MMPPPAGQYDPRANDPGFRFQYNLLVQRMNELGAILTAAWRANPCFLSDRVLEELECAAAFMAAGQFAMAERCCEEAEYRFLDERRRQAERHSPRYQRLEDRLQQALRQIWVNEERTSTAQVSATEQLRVAWHALEDLDYERAERLCVEAECAVRVIHLGVGR
jgi:hypothetical protein